ncbi:MAG: hypothetical protein OES79_14505, partial [Planctomycetota bacterium]|nr:hypothetical protein [Planctomycetota bacterium]
RSGTPATSEAAAAAAPKSAAPAPTGILSDNDGIAYYRSTGQASPAVVDAYLRGQLGANELRANHARQQGLELHRQVRRALPTDAKRRAIEKTSEHVDIVYEIEGTGEQILATLVGLKTQPAAVQFVSADVRLGKMLASLPSRAENDAEKKFVDQLAQADPQATGKLKSHYFEDAAADDDVNESFADKEAKQDLSDAPTEPAAGSKPQEAARGFAQPQRAAAAANAPDVAKNVKPAAEASESRAGGRLEGNAGRVARELQKKAQQGQAAKDAALARSARRRREADRVDGLAESSPPAPAADIESPRKSAALPAGEKAVAADKGGAARDQQPGQPAEHEKSSETRYKILLVFRLDNAAWLGNSDNPAAARQAIGDESPAATEAEK